MGARRHPSEANWDIVLAAWAALDRDPLFGGLTGLVRLWTRPEETFPSDGRARLVVRAIDPRRRAIDPRRRGVGKASSTVEIEVNLRRRGAVEEWMHVLAQCLLHVAANHVDPVRSDTPSRHACAIEAGELLRGFSIGQRPSDLAPLDVLPPGRDLDTTAAAIRDGGAEAEALYGVFGTAGGGNPTWVFEGRPEAFSQSMRRRNADAFAGALRRAIRGIVEAAGMQARGPASATRDPNAPAERARAWFVAGYPLLAALAAAFDIVEDVETCRRYDIAVASVDPEQRVVYVNPNHPWTPETLRFVIAHEFLHVGLRHEARRQGRDPFLWNVACD